MHTKYMRQIEGLENEFAIPGYFTVRQGADAERIQKEIWIEIHLLKYNISISSLKILYKVFWSYSSSVLVTHLPLW